ncbi:MAG: hypothetical protein CMN02_13130 [Roseibacillus sp.]|nr:hypothetical protein [Roseibacillus sp.]
MDLYIKGFWGVRAHVGGVGKISWFAWGGAVTRNNLGSGAMSNSVAQEVAYLFPRRGPCPLAFKSS